MTTITEHLIKCILADISDSDNQFAFEEDVTYTATHAHTQWRITRNERTIWLTAFNRSLGIVEDTSNYRDYVQSMKEVSLKELLREIFKNSPVLS